jgi:polysaccharide deacetylase 2 family uncharacterized protein YibQ
LAVVIAAAFIAAVVLFLERVEHRPDDSGTRRGPGKEALKKASTGKPPGRKLKPAPPGIEHPGRSVAIIIDDIGYDLQIVKELACIPAPIAFAVLPYTPHAVESAELFHAAGKEILLHLPMEPRSYPEGSPGEGALMADMDAGEIRRRIREDLAAVPFVSGVNNHMGSRFMEDEARLAVVMEELRAKGLFFVDSLTTDNSRGRESAGRAHVRFIARDVFIDYTPGYAVALKSLTGVFRQGRKNGAPILMIGHPYMETVRAIRDVLPLWQKNGVKVIPVSACLRISGGAGEQDPFIKNRQNDESASERKALDDPDISP